MEKSYVKELPYHVYFSSLGLGETKLFNDLVFKITPAVDSEMTAHTLVEAKPSPSQVPSPILTPRPIPTPKPSETPAIINTPTPFPSIAGMITKIKVPSSTPKPTKNPTPTPAPTAELTIPRAVNFAEIEREIFGLINEQRVENGLSALTWDDSIASVARAHSVDMNNRNFFDHVNPDGLNPFDRMKAGGINYSKAAENIVGTQTAQLMIKAWMNSEGHRKNILDPSYGKTGIGVSQSSEYGLVATQNFTN